MVFPIRRRLSRGVLGTAVVVSTLSCFGAGRADHARIGDDVVMSGSSIYQNLGDSVSGDAILAAREIYFVGAIGGDYLGVGGNQTIGGRIHGSARAAGGNIGVKGFIDRNATIAAGNVTVDSTGDIGRNAYLVGGNVKVEGTVRGGLLASGGNVVLNGTIGRDVEVSGGSLRVGPHAVITGNLRYRVPAEKVHIDSAARISGTVIALPVSKGWGLWRWLWMIGVLLAGAVVVALLPRFTAEAAEIISHRPIRSPLTGIGWFILGGWAIVILGVTIIGLPLALLAAVVYLFVLFLADVPFAVWLGHRLLGTRARPGRWGAVLTFLVGGLLLAVVTIIPVVGPVVRIVSGCFGIGAIVLRLWALRRSPVV